MADSILEIDGQRYMSSKAAADLWHVSPKTIAKYCREDKIVNKFKSGSLGWYIRIDEIKPLTTEQVRRLLVLTLQLKNDPSLNIDWSTLDVDVSILDNIYQRLHSQGYIQPFVIGQKQRIPYEVVLTSKGMELATSFKKEKIKDFSTTVTQWVPIIISIAQLYAQIKG